MLSMIFSLEDTKPLALENVDLDKFADSDDSDSSDDSSSSDEE